MGTDECASEIYKFKPSDFDIESYDCKMMKAVRAVDIDDIKHIVEDGYSVNACNKFGESVVHAACRYGKKNILGYLIEKGATLKRTDDYGRTPLHDCCWRLSNRDIQGPDTLVDVVMEADINMWFLKDIRGHYPLQYVPKDRKLTWLKFIESRIPTMVDAIRKQRGINT